MHVKNQKAIQVNLDFDEACLLWLIFRNISLVNLPQSVHDYWSGTLMELESALMNQDEWNKAFDPDGVLQFYVDNERYQLVTDGMIEIKPA